eukprot:2177832-Lingulodinium_polyedra.AAC.1
MPGATPGARDAWRLARDARRTTSGLWRATRHAYCVVFKTQCITRGAAYETLYDLWRRTQS